MNKCKHFVEYKGQKTTLLSWTSDMDAWSFSLPAGKEGACPMAVYGDNAVCQGCYASINRYNMPNVLKSQWVRFLWVKDLLETPAGIVKAHKTLVTAIGDTVKNGFFRGHDSGDFFHPNYIFLWYLVCRDLPQISFWFPTRSWQAKNIKWKMPFDQLKKLSNVSVRPSGLYVDRALIIDDWHAPTMVVSDLQNVPDGVKPCPKTVNGGSCTTNSCRTCWSKDTAVAYLVHGYMGASKLANGRSERILGTRKRILAELIELTVKGDHVNS